MTAGLDVIGKGRFLGEEGKGGSGGWCIPAGRTPNAVDWEGHLVMLRGGHTFPRDSQGSERRRKGKECTKGPES